MKKKLLPFLFTLFPLTLLLAEEASCPVENTKGYNAPHFLKLQNPWHFSSQLSFLYWQPKEVGTDLGATKKIDLSQAGKTIPMHGRFKPGVEACIEISHLKDNWDIKGRYLHLTAREGKLFETKSNEQLLPYWQHEISSSDNPSFSDAHWVLHLNMGDLELGRSYFVSPKISLSAFVSFRALWLHQKYNVFYTYEEGILFSHLKTHSYLLGPHMGMRSCFQLAPAFSFLANFGATLGAQHFKNQMQSNFFSGIDLLPFAIGEKRWQITPSFDSSLGLQWGSYFYQKKGHVKLALFYEFLYLWNQNAMRQLKDVTSQVNGSFSRSAPESGDLFFQGLTATASLDF